MLMLKLPGASGPQHCLVAEEILYRGAWGSDGGNWSLPIPNCSWARDPSLLGQKLLATPTSNIDVHHDLTHPQAKCALWYQRLGEVAFWGGLPVVMNHYTRSVLYASKRFKK